MLGQKNPRDRVRGPSSTLTRRLMTFLANSFSRNDHHMEKLHPFFFIHLLFRRRSKFNTAPHARLYASSLPPLLSLSVNSGVRIPYVRNCMVDRFDSASRFLTMQDRSEYENVVFLYIFIFFLFSTFPLLCLCLFPFFRLILCATLSTHLSSSNCKNHEN